jgi:hypothetical protein
LVEDQCSSLHGVAGAEHRLRLSKAPEEKAVNALRTWRGWLHGLLAMVIGGAASAGSAWIGLAVGKASGLDVPVLNWKALGLVLLTSGLINAFLYLKQSPLPDFEEPKTENEKV